MCPRSTPFSPPPRGHRQYRRPDDGRGISEDEIRGAWNYA